MEEIYYHRTSTRKIQEPHFQVRYRHHKLCSGRYATSGPESCKVLPFSLNTILAGHLHRRLEIDQDHTSVLDQDISTMAVSMEEFKFVNIASSLDVWDLMAELSEFRRRLDNHQIDQKESSGK